MLTLPILDDRTFDDLLSEARSLIPLLQPQWTDHNPTDPGIMLLELLAWMTEMVIFRIDQVPESSQWNFLRLLNGASWAPQAATLDEAVRATRSELQRRHVAVTAEDYEYLTLTQWPQERQLAAGAAKIARVRCLYDRNLELDPSNKIPFPGHISLVLLMAPDPKNPAPPVPPNLLAFFADRRLLATHLHAVLAASRSVNVAATLYLKSGAEPGAVRSLATSAISKLLNPFAGGPAGGGWPFGRAIHASDLFTVLDGVAGVDFVRDLMLADAAASPPSAPASNTAVAIGEHELPSANTVLFRLMQPTIVGWKEVLLGA